MQRISVVGASGSGKTTLARRLSLQLALPHVEMDALYWEPNWQEARLEVFRERVSQALAGERWVVDGSFSKVRDITWSRADTVVWLDYPLPRVLWQLTHRTLRRISTGEELWSGNRETWRETFLSRESIFLWTLRSHPRHRRTYPVQLQQPKYSHLHLVRLYSPRATLAWMAGLDSTVIRSLGDKR